MSKKLIALVATAVMVGGERVVIQPGQELPDLAPHDERELVASGAAENPEDTAALAKQDARDQAEAAKEFEQARAKVQEKQDSTAPDADANGDNATATPAKAKAAGKK